MKTLCLLILKLIGWKITRHLPNEKKYILIVAPHTSNWDLVIGLLGRFAEGVRINFFAKNQVFFFPLGSFLRAVGGTPVDRSKKGDKVHQAVELIQQSNQFILGLAPEGTRSPVKRWKEGFYHIACQAGIPIVMVGLDYASKEIRVSELFWPVGDINVDFPKIMDYFRAIKGCYPKEIPEYHPKNLG